MGNCRKATQPTRRTPTIRRVVATGRRMNGRDESLAAVHSAAGRYHPPDGRRPSRGLGCFPAITHLAVAASRLPHDPGTNVLSRRQPRSNGFFGHGPSRTPIRTDSWVESDYFDEFLRELDDHAAIQFGPKYRRR